jgi:hypothetical protein
MSSVADPHHIDVDPDQPFRFDVDPDPTLKQIRDHWHMDLSRLHFKPPRLLCERPRTSMAPLQTPMAPEFGLHCEFGSRFHSDAGSDPQHRLYLLLSFS